MDGKDRRTLADGNVYTLGPSVEIIPVITADGSSVDLTVTAKLIVPTESESTGKFP